MHGHSAGVGERGHVYNFTHAHRQKHNYELSALEAKAKC